MDNLFLSFGGPLVLVEDKIMFLKVTLSVKVDPLPYLVLEGDYGFELVCFPLLSHVCLGIFKVEAFA